MGTNRESVRLRGRPPVEKTIRDRIRRELESISRYAQFRLRGLSYDLKLVEKEKSIELIVSVPLPSQGNQEEK